MVDQVKEFMFEPLVEAVHEAQIVVGVASCPEQQLEMAVYVGELELAVISVGFGEIVDYFTRLEAS